MDFPEQSSSSSSADVEVAKIAKRRPHSPKKRQPSITSAMNVDAETKAKLDQRKTSHLARAMTTPTNRELSLVDMAKQEAELELPQSVRDFAAAAFGQVADPDTETIAVDGDLTHALKLIGHTTNDMALKDICSRFNLQYPEHHHEELAEGAEAEQAEGGKRPEGGQKRGAHAAAGGKPAREQSAEAAKTAAAVGETRLELDMFLAIVYSELIDQAQPADLAKSFGLFDKDGNGEVDMNEFEAGLMALGDMNPLDLEDRKAFLDKIDVDGDFTLSSKELVTWLANDTFEQFKSRAGAVVSGSGRPAGPPTKPRKQPSSVNI